jgi:hypothetical protein
LFHAQWGNYLEEVIFEFFQMRGGRMHLVKKFGLSLDVNSEISLQISDLLLKVELNSDIFGHRVIKLTVSNLSESEYVS